MPLCVYTRVCIFKHSRLPYRWSGFSGGSLVKNPPADAGDVGLFPGPGRVPREGMEPHSSILAWESPWTEEPSGLQSMGLQESWT